MSFVYRNGVVSKRNGSAFLFWHRVRTLLWAALFTALFFALFLGVTLLYYMRTQATLDSHVFSLYLRNQEKTTTLVAKAAQEEIEPSETHLYASQNRICVSYDRLPQALCDAFVSIEDERFYRHRGVDLYRTLGATGGFLAGKASYGGSTITQQLIKNVTGENEASPRRKIKEIGRAWQLERDFSKEEILCMYLNTVYFSGHCYGVQAASQTFFGKNVEELTLPECASLAAIVQSPAKWSPLHHPEAHLERRNLVLSKMQELSYITEEACAAAQKAPLLLSEVRQGETGAPIYSWYTETVLDEASEILANLYSIDRAAALRLLYTGGFTVLTAERPDVQRTLQEIYESQSAFPYVDNSLIQPESAAVVLDPHTGAILGIVGGRGKKQENRVLHYATACRRPPGSAIKPLSVYAPAMQAGLLNYATVYDDTPVNFEIHEEGWPQNYPVGYRGLTAVHDAVARSVNTVAVKALADYGVEASFAFLRDKIHLSSLVAEQKGKSGAVYTDCALAPLALGQLTYGVSVLELTAGYTVFAAEGSYHAPFSVWELRDENGNVLFSRDTTGEAVLSQGNAQVMTQMLHEVTTKGTASALTLADKMDAAGKTGTTTDDCDRWFVGYTRDYLCGVWFGYASPQPLTGFSERKSPAVSVWDRVMCELERQALRTGERKPFSTSCLVRTRFCADSGKLPTDTCSRDPRGARIQLGYFTPEQLPHRACDCHVRVSYDTVHGGVSLGGCPHEHCRQVGMITAPHRDFPRQMIVDDAQYVYRPLDGALPVPYQNQPFFANALPKGHYVGISASSEQFNRGCYADWYAWHFSEEADLYEEEFEKSS